MTGKDRSTAPARYEEGPNKRLIGAESDGLGTVTDYDSTTVMLQAGRRDNIEITEVLERFGGGEGPIPDAVSVVQRQATYFGPKLLVHAEIDGQDHNYLLTAPGPGTNLLLWAANVNERGGKRMRSSWCVAAEVRAVMAAEQPPYPECPDCDELVRTIEHERMAAIGQCSRAGNGGDA